MARDEIAAGRMKQARGKANDVWGAAAGDTDRQLKGKAEKAVGKAHQKLGKRTTKGR